MNEPVVKNSQLLKEVYKELIRRIRKIDKNRILFLEPDLWAQELEGIKDMRDENIIFSIHFYLPLEFTFNFIKGLKYPGKINGIFWNRERG